MLIYREYVAELKKTLDQLPLQKIEQIVDLLFATWLADKQVFVMGNGGSASTASHMACDLGKNTAIPGVRRVRVMSLNDNMALFSAHANDNGYENVFAEQLSNFLYAGDVVIAISASGNSPNVLRAVERAGSLGATTVGLSGYQGGQLAQMVDVPVVIRNDNIEQIEDIHLMLEHMVTMGLRQSMLEAMQAPGSSETKEVRIPANGRTPHAVFESAD